MSSTAGPAPSGSKRSFLVLAAALAVLGGESRVGHYLLYPFTLLATWVHEMGHGLTAILVGGRFDHLEIFRDASGLAYATSPPGVAAALVALGGLVAPPLIGAMMLSLARGPRRARHTLTLLAIALLVSSLTWVRTPVGLLAAPAVALIALAVVRWGSAGEHIFFAQLIGLRLAFDTLGRGLAYLFIDSTLVDGVQRASDIANVATGLGGPRLVYSVGVATLSVTLIGLGLYAAWRPRCCAGAPSCARG